MNDVSSKVLVVGATGFLGRTLSEAGSEMVPAARHSPEDSHWVQLDLEVPNRFGAVLDEVGPGWVVNAAAVTSVDGCETDPDRARRVHVDGVSVLAKACGERNIRLVQLSTNYVFDGTDGPYDENDAPNPLGVYGQTKLEGEKVALSACEACVVRTAVLYGYHPAARPNFVTRALGELQAGNAIRVVTDEWSNPTYLPDLVASIRGLTAKDATGIYHVGGLDYLTRFEMVEELCDVFGLARDLVTPVESEDLGQIARRPLRAGLTTTRADAFLDTHRTGFRQNLESLKVLMYPTEGERASPA